jgi:DNA-binding response OmpR family regulator
MKPPTILIADDDRELAEILAGRCRRLGLSVITAYEGIPAINAIRDQAPDLVCLDMNLPAGNGLSICEMMAKDPLWSKIPVILLTGNSEPSTIMRCHEMCVYYVQKSTDVWQRIEPLLYELLDIAPSASVKTDHAEAAHKLMNESNESHRSELLDAVFEILGGQKPSSESGPATEPADLADRTPWILHIEDDADFSEVLSVRLKGHGIKVVRAFSGMEGYRTAFMHPANAVILDVELPNGQGDYVLRRLKENPVTRDLPVIMLTGKKERTVERKMRAMGADAFLTKPLDMKVLLRELHRFIEFPNEEKVGKTNRSNGAALSTA